MIFWLENGDDDDDEEVEDDDDSDDKSESDEEAACDDGNGDGEENPAKKAKVVDSATRVKIASMLGVKPPTTAEEDEEDNASEYSDWDDDKYVVIWICVRLFSNLLCNFCVFSYDLLVLHNPCDSCDQ